MRSPSLVPSFTLTVLIVGLLVGAAGCDCGAQPTRDPIALGPDPSLQPAAAEPDPFIPYPANHERFTNNDRLLERLTSSPHGYFRFINIPFSQAVCEEFAEQLPSAPAVNLHGDAHLEQYAVTDSGAGLEDFDDASSGPPILDLVRFIASIHLAAGQRNWEPDSAIASFLSGYRECLEDPDMERTEVAFVTRTRAAFSRTRPEFLEWATTLMNEPQGRSDHGDAHTRYSALMLEEHSDFAPAFFDVKARGTFRMGVGSALDEKFLVRIEGPTVSDDDDRILEYKEVRDLSGISCVTAASGAFRILVGHSRIGGGNERLVAQVSRGAGQSPYWVREWAMHYDEVDVNESLTSVEDLDQVALDVGRQLGRGHAVGIATPFDSQLRRSILELLDAQELRIQEVARRLADRTRNAYQTFASQRQD